MCQTTSKAHNHAAHFDTLKYMKLCQCVKNHIIFLAITYIITIDANIPNIVIIGVNISCVINLSKIVAFIIFLLLISLVTLLVNLLCLLCNLLLHCKILLIVLHNEKVFRILPFPIYCIAFDLFLKFLLCLIVLNLYLLLNLSIFDINTYYQLL